MSRSKIEPEEHHTFLRAINTDPSMGTFNPSLAVTDIARDGRKNYSLLVEGVPMNPFAQRNVGFLFDATRSRPLTIFNKDAQTLQDAFDGLSLKDPDGKFIMTLSTDKFLQEFKTLDALKEWLLAVKDNVEYPKMNNDIVAADIGVENITGVFYCNTVTVSNEDFFSETPSLTESAPVDFLPQAMQLQSEIAKQHGKTVPIYEWDSALGVLFDRTPKLTAYISPTSSDEPGITFAPDIPSVTYRQALSDMKDDKLETEISSTPPTP